MFLDNRTGLSVLFKRGLVVDDVAVLTVGVEASFAVEADGTLRLLEPQEAKPTDPPDPRERLLWRGTSVTVAGQVPGPSGPPFVQPVRLQVGDEERRLIVFGERHWGRRGKQLVASEPAPFDTVGLEWRHAFGGTFELEPGYAPHSKLPHPGGTIPHPLNPDGTGYWPSAEAARGQLLPAIEDANQLVQRWDDSPTPAGFAACPELVGLRSSVWAERLKDSRMHEQGLAEQIRESIHATLWLQHHAPPPLIFDEVAAGTVIALDGMGAPLRFVVGASSIDVAVRAADGASSVPRPRLRSVHLDADERTLRVCWGFGHRFAVDRPPHWIHAEQRRAAA